MGTRKSGRAISVAKEGLFVMRRAGCGMGPAGGGQGVTCVFVYQCWRCVSLSSSSILFKVSAFHWKRFPKLRQGEQQRSSVHFPIPSVSNSVLILDARFDLDSCPHEESRPCDMIYEPEALNQHVIFRVSVSVQYWSREAKVQLCRYIHLLHLLFACHSQGSGCKSRSRAFPRLLISPSS